MYLTYQTRIAFRLSAIALSAVLSACGSNNSNQNTGTPAVSIEQPVVSLSGRAMGGRQPIIGATVYVYAASGSSPSAPVQIGSATTTASGTFNIASFSPAPATGDLIYVSSVGGDAGSGNNPQAALMTVAGTYGSLTGNVQINELTTVAVTSQLQSLLIQAPCNLITGNTAGSGNCPVINGQAAGWSTQVSAIANLVSVGTGQANGSLGSSSLQNMNLQASVLANCINSNGGVAGDSSACGNFLNLAKSATTNGVLTAKSPATVAASEPDRIAVTPDGKTMYAVNPNNDTVSVFSIASNGALTPKSPATVATGTGPSAIAVTPDGKTAYVTNFSGNNVSVFSISSNGTLSPKSPATVATGSRSGPVAIAVTPDGKTAYVVNSRNETISLFSIDSNGALTAKSPATVATGMTPNAIAVTPDGKTAYVANVGSNTVSLFSIASNGALTAKTPATVATGFGPETIAVTPDGKTAYVTINSNNNISVFSIASDGALTPKNPATVATGSIPRSIAVSPDGTMAYVTNQGDNTVSIFSIGSNGALTAKSPSTVAVGSVPSFIVVTPNGQSVYVTNLGDNSVSMLSIGLGTPADSQSGMIGLHADPASKAAALFALKPVTAVYTPMPSSAPATLALP